MTEPEKAWLACAIDGEGYILVQDAIEKKSGWRRRRVVIGVCNTDANFLAEAGRLIGNSKLCIQSRSNISVRRKPCYMVRQQDRFKAAAVLKEILPYLIIKKAKAVNGIQLVDNTDWSIRHSKASRQKLSLRMKELWRSGAFTGTRGMQIERRKKLG